MKRTLPVWGVLGVFAALILCSGRAAAGAREGLAVCAATLVPSLFPFFVLTNLLSALGLPDLLGGLFGGAMQRVFHISPAGAQAFFLGLTGGYPLGASVVADLRHSGRVSREEAERLLAFCNNSGPGFILGAAGGVFHSARAGLLLYLTHMLGAVTVGLLFRGRTGRVPAEKPAAAAPQPFPAALTSSLTRALSATMTVCGYVVLFGALLALIGPLSALPPVAGALCQGFWELSSGIAALAGVPPTPVSLAAAALLLGWGGLSVHCQTMGVLADTDISCARHLAGRALCGTFAALYAFLGALLLFQ